MFYNSVYIPEVSWKHDDWEALKRIDPSVRKEITVMIGSPMPIDEKLIELLPNLKWIHSTHAGLSGDQWAVCLNLTDTSCHWRKQLVS